MAGKQGFKGGDEGGFRGRGGFSRGGSRGGGGCKQLVLSLIFIS